MQNAIEIRGLTKNYGRHRGVTEVSFCVKEGEVFGFLGPNGAGKSTTIRAMLGLIRCEGGSVRIFGRDMRKHREELLGEIGYMPSEAMFYPSMRVREVIAMAAEARRKDCSEEAQRLCERLQVDTGKKISELSLGNRKKVGIVCAMQHRPRLFVFDEPTSGLDPLMQAEFFKLVREAVDGGTTCMLSTHVLPEIKRYCETAAIMKEGKLLCVDSVSNLTKTAAKRVRVTCRESGRDGVRQEDWLFEGDLKQLLGELARQDIQDILIEEPSLEDVFMRYYETERPEDRKAEGRTLST